MEDGLRDVDEKLIRVEEYVLILVLMEDGLREVNLQLADLQTFRAQKCSKFQKSREKKYIFRLQNYKNFPSSQCFFHIFYTKISINNHTSIIPIVLKPFISLSFLYCGVCFCSEPKNEMDWFAACVTILC